MVVVFGSVMNNVLITIHLDMCAILVHTSVVMPKHTCACMSLYVSTYHPNVSLSLWDKNICYVIFNSSHSNINDIHEQRYMCVKAVVVSSEHHSPTVWNSICAVTCKKHTPTNTQSHNTTTYIQFTSKENLGCTVSFRRISEDRTVHFNNVLIFARLKYFFYLSRNRVERK